MKNNKIIYTVVTLVAALLCNPMAIAQEISGVNLSSLSSSSINAHNNYPENNNNNNNNNNTESNNRITLNQGDSIYTGSGLCTIGYVDMVNKKAYTAAHCFAASRPDNLTYGSAVYLGGTNTFVGRFTGGVYTGKVRDVDTAEITLLPNVYGENIYSGNNVVKKSNIVVGEKACFTGMSSKKTMCGTISEVENYVQVNKTEGGRPGDSGGPIWIPGKGYVANITRGQYLPGTEKGAAGGAIMDVGNLNVFNNTSKPYI